MNDVSNSDIDEMLKHTDLQGFCSPFSGNCFEVALALHRMFTNSADGFYSVYAEPEFKTDSNVLRFYFWYDSVLIENSPQTNPLVPN